MEAVRFAANYSLYDDCIELRFKRGKSPGKLEFGEEVASGLYMEPSGRLLLSEAQELADALWSAGIRPSQGKQSEGVTAAQAKHLEDMRAIAFTKLKVERP